MAVNALNPNVWDECINLALEAYNAGSFGIAAIIVDKNGEVVAKGRNQLGDNLNSCNAIKMTPIAHAEINALNNLPPERQKDRELTLYTTVEPCPMCTGAVVMSRIRQVMVGSADPWAGAIRLLDKDWYLKQKGISVVFEQGKVEELCFALHYLSLKRGLRTEHPVFAVMQSRYPDYSEKLDGLINSSQLTISEHLCRAQLLELIGC